MSYGIQGGISSAAQPAQIDPSSQPALVNFNEALANVITSLVALKERLSSAADRAHGPEPENKKTSGLSPVPSGLLSEIGAKIEMIRNFSGDLHDVALRIDRIV